MNNIEVEVRGLVATEKVASLENFLAEHGNFKEEKNRILIDYSTFLPGEGIKERIRDIRLRVTNGQPEIIVKVGNWGGSENRKEISVKPQKGDFDKLVQIFGIIGLIKGVLCIRFSKIYEYKGIEFAIVEVPGHSHYFEAEIMVDETHVLEAKHDIQQVCGNLGLNIFSDDEFYAYIETLNKDANEIFDYGSYEEGYFQKRFNL